MFSYFLLVLVTWQIIGFVGYFEISHYKLKKEIKGLLKRGVPKDELVVFSFNEMEISQLVWLKKNEFRLGDDLFDVVRRKEMSNGQIRMECISDEQEEVLFSSLQQSISNNLNDESDSNSVLTLFKILSVPAIVPHQPEIKSNKDFVLNNDQCFEYAEYFESVYPALETPPPIIS